MLVPAFIQKLPSAERNASGEYWMAGFLYDIHEGVCAWLPCERRSPLVVLPNLLRARAHPDKVSGAKLADIVSRGLSNLLSREQRVGASGFVLRQIIEVVEAAEEDNPVLKLARVTPEPSRRPVA